MCWNFWLHHFLLLLFCFSASLDAQLQNLGRIGRNEETEIGFGRRALLSFKESPHGSNVTFDCSRSGPCVACLLSEKDENYGCSETGYRIPLKCVEVKDTSKVSNEKKSHDGRSTLEMSYEHKLVNHLQSDASDHASSVAHRHQRDGSISGTVGSQDYIIYRSCIPSVNDEKLSVLGFENQNSMANQCNLWIFFSSSVVKMIANIISSQICSTKEGIVLGLLLISGSVVYFRRKRSVSTAGFASGRVQSNSRF
ncbi:uncharacterized protein LOC111781939 isoform X2 [Cucurbita pepo subsp. pepo]|uniref:uncharacterized protein LOC111781939 isoform X2 n=1 Tax=Cucurbita pepo subsp. pepo TaxID=3664 RepID=UPI000C9D3148|nr:uncharacterized protein LOC111781939 isoform X2 [Cucurbita pepo subsp. pepo]